MPRLPNLLNRDELPESLHGAFDQVAGSRQGSVSGPYGILLHSPELAVRGAAMSNYLRWNSALTAVQRETAILAAAREYDAAVMWAGHVRLGREVGVSDATIDLIANRGDLEGVDEETAEIVRYVRELLTTNRVSQPTFDALHARLGDQGIVDLTGLVGYYGFVGTILNAFEVPTAAGAPTLP